MGNTNSGLRKGRGHLTKGEGLGFKKMVACKKCGRDAVYWISLVIYWGTDMINSGTDLI